MPGKGGAMHSHFDTPLGHVTYSISAIGCLDSKRKVFINGRYMGSIERNIGNKPLWRDTECDRYCGSQQAAAEYLILRRQAEWGAAMVEAIANVINEFVSVDGNNAEYQDEISAAECSRPRPKVQRSDDNGDERAGEAGEV